MNTRPYCLSIAGYDPTAGAGVLADIKTFEQHQVYGMAIITANTLQTDNHFKAVQWIDAHTILQQVENLMHAYSFQALKIGLIENYDTLYQVIKLVKKIQPNVKIVWDTILESSSGFHFHDNNSLELDFLQENCTLITPNRMEFESLWGNNPSILKTLKPQAAFLIKGGHWTEKTGCDILFQHGIETEITGKSFHGKTKHGTGCVLSAAITAQLTRENSLLESCIKGKEYVEQFILSNDTNLGYHAHQS